MVDELLAHVARGAGGGAAPAADVAASPGGAADARRAARTAAAPREAGAGRRRRRARRRAARSGRWCASARRPGMNKPGGVARVSAVGEDGTYNVKYVVDCTKSALGEACSRPPTSDGGGGGRAASGRALAAGSPAAAPTPASARRERARGSLAAKFAEAAGDAIAPLTERQRAGPAAATRGCSRSAENNAEPCIQGAWDPVPRRRARTRRSPTTCSARGSRASSG